MSAIERTMVNFQVGPRLFNYRAAAIALRDGHVLICHEDDNDYVMLPGGRVEMGEASNVALAREVAEELRVPADIGPLVFTVENFFHHNGRDVHELAAYYRIELPAEFPFRSGGVVLEVEDSGQQLRFEWIALEGNGLRERNIMPPWLPEKLRQLPATTTHLILHEPPR